MRVLPLLAISLFLFVPLTAHAGIDGAEEIQARHGALDSWEQSLLGDEDGVVVETAIGSKQVYENGAIYWDPQHGALLVDPVSWARYGFMDAETGVLGFPVGERFEHMQRFTGGVLAGKRTDQYVVRGILLTVWEKNGDFAGPLGQPMSDSEITVASGKIPATQTARQFFVGAIINYSLQRMIIGGDAWEVEVVSKSSAKFLRVKMTGRMEQPGKSLDVSINKTRWWHWSDPESGRWEILDNQHIQNQGHRRIAAVDLLLEAEGSDAVRITRALWGWVIRRPGEGDLLVHKKAGGVRVVEENPVVYAPGEMTMPAGSEFFGQSMSMDFISVTQRSIRASDIVF